VVTESQPVALNYVAGEPAGLILAAGLVDRWVHLPFEDQEVAAATTYEQRKQLVRTTLSAGIA